MIRTLLTTTALAALMSTAVIAQDAPANNTMAPATETAPVNNTMAPAAEAAPANTTMAPAAEAAPANNTMAPPTEPAPANTTMAPAAETVPANTTMAPATEAMPADNAMAPADGAMGMDMSVGYAAAEGDSLASDLIGTTIYSTAGDDAETIGEINDMVVGTNGDIMAVVIGVGGFLGIGEKNVAVDWSALEWTQATDGTFRWVLPTTADALTTAPDFVYDDQTADDAAMTTVEPVETEVVDDAAVTPVEGDPAVVEAPDATATTAAPFDRTTLTEATLTAEELIGTGVYGPNDEQIGTIGDFLLGEDGASIDAVIVDVGGFLGLGVKEVAVGFDNLSFSADANNNRYLFLNTTAEQLEAQPEFNRDTYAAERDTQRMMMSM